MRSPLENESISDNDTHVRKVGSDFAKMRKPHLQKIQPLIDHAKQVSTLPVVYDITRLHHPYFNEFTYTEFLGCLYISPQSVEVAARLTQKAFEDTNLYEFDIVGKIFERNKEEKTLDKYNLKLEEDTLNPKKVVFIPGDNVFKTIISREILTTVMMTHEDCLIKPHPMSTGDLLRTLGREFGYRRIIEPLASGWKCLQDAEEVYCSTATEMGIYAALLEKPIHNIGNYLLEARGAYTPFYRLMWNKSIPDTRATVEKILNSPLSGVFHHDDPLAKEKIETFFKAAMEIRSYMKPLTHEIGLTEWADLQQSKLVPQTVSQPPQKG